MMTPSMGEHSMPIATRAACLALALVVSAAVPALHAEEEREISNDELTWDGNIIGLQPTLTGRALRIARGEEQRDPMELVALLRDKQRFAVAHVVLVAQIHGLGSWGTSQWYGLPVSLYGDGTVVYDPRGGGGLASRWERYFRNAKRKTPAEYELFHAAK
jgi:hypothetical protein